MHPRPSLSDHNRSGFCRRPSAELDAEHLWELVAPVAGGAPLLLGGAVKCLVVGLVRHSWVSCGWKEEKKETEVEVEVGV